MKKIAIIIPTYNELDNIESLISAILVNLPDCTIFVIDDSKNKDIGNLIDSKKLKAKYFHRENAKGRGSAVLFGFRKALEENRYDIFIKSNVNRQIKIRCNSRINENGK